MFLHRAFETLEDSKWLNALSKKMDTIDKDFHTDIQS